MDNKKYKKGITEIYKRIDCLTAMASLDETDMSAILIELDQLNAQIADIDTDIKAYTPTTADLNAAKNNDQVRLSTLQIQLADLKDQLSMVEDDLQTDHDLFVELDTKMEANNYQKKELSKQVEKFESYKSGSREFKAFVNENKRNIETLDEEVKSLQAEKKHVSNSIQVLSEKRDSLSSEIEQLTKEVESIEFNLTSDKNYKDSTIVQSKKRMLTSLKKEKEDLLAQVEVIKNSPAYIAHTIKENIDAKAHEDETLELINKLAKIAASQPYMDKVIRGGNVTELTKEYDSLRRKRNKLAKTIESTDYNVKVLPIEEARTSIVEKLINLNNSDVEQHESAIKKNQIAIAEIASTLTDLSREHKEKVEAVGNYEETVVNTAEGREKAKHKKQLQLQKEALKIEEEIIARLKGNIESLIDKNADEQTIIDSLTQENKAYAKETTEILNVQLKRSNYRDVIKEGQDSKELETLEGQIAHLRRRLEYQNYNVTTLKNEILSATKRVYGPKKTVAKKQEEKQVELEAVKAQEVASLDELLDNSKKKTTTKDTDKVQKAKEDYKASKSTFEDTLKLAETMGITANDTRKESLSDGINIDLDAILKSEEDKVKATAKTKGPDIIIGDKIENPDIKVEKTQEVESNKTTKADENILVDIINGLAKLQGKTPKVTKKATKEKEEKPSILDEINAGLGKLDGVVPTIAPKSEPSLLDSINEGFSKLEGVIPTINTATVKTEEPNLADIVNTSIETLKDTVPTIASNTKETVETKEKAPKIVQEKHQVVNVEQIVTDKKEETTEMTMEEANAKKVQMKRRVSKVDRQQLTLTKKQFKHKVEKLEDIKNVQNNQVVEEQTTEALDSSKEQTPEKAATYIYAPFMAGSDMSQLVSVPSR